MNIFPDQNVIYILHVFLLVRVNVKPAPVIGNALSPTFPRFAYFGTYPVKLIFKNMACKAAFT
jgi:hypothetical protein